jgi:2-polyprenyl-3-methyl-5-hydroxy-6-metoxy-1,4-benzoquinol methylase
MVSRNEWEEFFDGHAPVYMDNPFTKNTREEIDFLLEEFKLPLGSLILDMGCGTGRHAIELARHGYRVTGVDISSGMLREARKAAKEAGVEVEWIQADAVQFTPGKCFDAAICLCEGAFGLLSRDDDPLRHDAAILRNIHAALKPEAPFLLTASNGLRLIRKYSQEEVEKGQFDPLTMVEIYTMEYDTPEGKRSVQLSERGHLPTELVKLFRLTGFEVEHIGGGTAGNWGRRPLELDEIEVMVIAKKKAQND